MIERELLLLAAALVLLFALPLALLAWMAAQYAQMRQLASRLKGLEVSVSRLRESGPANLPKSEEANTADSVAAIHAADPLDGLAEATSEVVDDASKRESWFADDATEAGATNSTDLGGDDAASDEAAAEERAEIDVGNDAEDIGQDGAEW